MTRGEGLGGYGSHVLHRMALHSMKFDVLTGFLGVVVGSAVESMGLCSFGGLAVHTDFVFLSTAQLHSCDVLLKRMQVWKRFFVTFYMGIKLCPQAKSNATDLAT